MQQVKNTADGTFTMKWTFSGANSWIGVGINRRGWAEMTPADAVIGRIENDGEASVKLYSMTSDAENASGVQAYSSSTIKNAVFEQPDETTSVLTFTMDLAELDVSDSSTWIFAVGLRNNRWAGEHLISGSFEMALTDTCVEVADPTLSPTQAATVGTTDGETSTLDPAPVDTTAAATPESDPSQMVVVEPTDGQNGFDQAESASNGINLLETEKPYRNYWMIHGIFLAMAWGVCAPLGIGASLLRNVIQEKFGENWFYMHYYLNMLALLFTLVGFMIAVAATALEGDKHFTSNTHTKAGLSIMILAVAQALAGYFRPPASKKKVQEDPAYANETGKGSNGTDDDQSHEVVLNQNDEQEPPSTTRRVWEVCHRLGGMILLGLAWYNCDSGIQKQVDEWEDSTDWTNVFWGITVTISGSIFVLTYALRYD